MKPLFSIDLTNDKNNLVMNGTEFTVATPSDMLHQRLEKSIDEADEVVEQAKLPLVLTILQAICGVVGVAIVAGAIESLDGLSLKEMYQRAPWLFWVGAGCILGCLAIHFLGKGKAKAVLDTDESVNTFSKLSSVKDAIFTELSVPASAKEVDVLTFFYKVKNGGIKVCHNALQTAQYFNSAYKIYTDDEKFYVVNLEAKHAFPLTSLRTIRTVNKRVVVDEWNKDEKHNKGNYKPYKISVTKQGDYTYKGYHILELELDGEICGIYFPAYELPVFEEVTGLKAE